MIDRSKTMKVWRDNKIDQEEDIPVGELFDRFCKSEWPNRDDLGYESQVRGFLTMTEGVAFGRDDETTDRLWDLIDLAREAGR